MQKIGRKLGTASADWMDHQSTLVEGTRSKHGRFCTWHSSVICAKYSCAEDGTFFTHGACARSSHSFHASSGLLASCSSEWEERKKSRADGSSPWKSQDIFGPGVYLAPECPKQSMIVHDTTHDQASLRLRAFRTTLNAAGTGIKLIFTR